MTILTRAYPRAALVGNPSDGYYGKTIAFVFSNFHTEVTLVESPKLEIIPNICDTLVFSCMEQLIEDVSIYGYYGGVRLFKAAIKRFYEYCLLHTIPIEKRNFTLSYYSTIPLRLGLAGSSAIITACLRGLMRFYNVAISNPELANLVLSVEKQELQIEAGLQDRVAQVYQGLVYMDFNRQHMQRHGYGN